MFPVDALAFIVEMEAFEAMLAISGSAAGGGLRGGGAGS